jgi:2,3-dihydro-2,3-dihydroxybenzoate dehydrogenase
MISFLEKRVWVTGANRGIGAEIAQLLYELGAEVVGFDREFDASVRLYRTVVMDVGDATQVADVVKNELLAFGRLDVLINVAGVLQMNSLESIREEEWLHTMNVNVSGALWVLQAVIPWFKAQRQGSIVTISSNASHAPRIGMGAYSASKAALTNLTLTAGIELAAYGVRCNVVSPGSTNTDMQRQLWQDDSGEQSTIDGFPDQFKLGIPLGKIAQPRDIAYCAVFLASDWANHVTLQDLVVDGGATLGA